MNAFSQISPHGTRRLLSAGFALLLSTYSVSALAAPPVTPTDADSPEGSDAQPDVAPDVTEPVDIQAPATAPAPAPGPAAATTSAPATNPAAAPAPAAAPPAAETGAAVAKPPSTALPPPEPKSAIPEEDLWSAGFTLDRGAWIGNTHNEFGIGILTVLRYQGEFSANGVDSLGFTLPYVRPNLHGSLFDGKLRFFVQPELANPGPKLLDAQITYQPIPAFGLDIGQYRTHVSRAWITGIPVLAMPGRGMVDDAFHTDRALGITAFGKPFAGKFEYDVGILDAGGYNLAKPLELQPLVTARVAVNPLGAVPYTQTPAFAKVDKPVFGFAAHMWSDRYTPTAADPARAFDRQRVTFGGEFVFMAPRVHVLAEGFGQWQLVQGQRFDGGWGSQAQVGVMIVDHTLELQARAGVMDLSRFSAMQGMWEGGLSWYLFGNHLRAQLQYSCAQDFDTGKCRGQTARIQTQLWF